MPENFFDLTPGDQREAFEQVRAKTGRPTHLLEKDVWVVWTLRTLFDSPLRTDVTFKGGTSLSKAYQIINRFSEDIDLTYNIRKLIGDLVGGDSDLPVSRSQADRWSKAVRKRLPEWITTTVQPVLAAALVKDRLQAKIEINGKNSDSLILRYPALTRGTGYIPPTVVLEFGGRATGEPHQVMPIVCDMAAHLSSVSFPIASPLVMSVARTFWEKATAAHVYCAQGRIRSERYARHWHDLAAIARSQYFADIISDRTVAVAVARHKSFFFIEKGADGTVINYEAAVNGRLEIVPAREARDALAADYAAMMADDVMVGDALSFDRLIQACREIEEKANRAMAH